MIKKRTNSAFLYTDILNNFDYTPETPRIPFIKILQQPSVLEIPSKMTVNFLKNTQNRKKETTNRNKKKEEIFNKLVENMCFEIQLKKSQNQSRKRVFSDMTHIRNRKNSIFCFLENRIKK